MNTVMREIIKLPRISLANIRERVFSRDFALQAGILVGLFLLGYLAIAFRIDQAPDIFTDEILYTRLGIRALGEGALVWDSGRQIVIHPPMYFLVEGLFLKLIGADYPLYQPGDIFAAVSTMRLLNAVLAGLTAVLLYLMGTRLGSRLLGLSIAGLYLLDPFGVRINRRAMLETFAMLLALGGVYILLPRRHTFRRILAAGIFAGILMGAALLTKELVFTVPLAVLLYGFWELLRKNKAGIGAVAAASLAFLSYWLFPFWVLIDGDWARFIRVKGLAMDRLLGLVQTSGWNRPGVSLVDFLMQRLNDYGSSYLLLMLGGLATLLILVFGWRSAHARLLAVWGLVLYPFYAFMAIVGSGNDQFFYFLLVPAMIILVYALLGPVDYERQWLAYRFPRTHIRRQPALSVLRRGWRKYQTGIFVAVILLMVPFNLYKWYRLYGTGVDTGYAQVAAYVNQFVPAGAQINASGDSLKFEYFFPKHQITSAGTVAEAQAAEIQYFVLAPKDVQARYGAVTPELANWITIYGQLLFTTSGNSYGDIYLYQVGTGSTPINDNAGTIAPRTFPPAEQARIASFLILSLVWMGAWSAAGIRLWITTIPAESRLAENAEGVFAEEINIEQDEFGEIKRIV